MKYPFKSSAKEIQRDLYNIVYLKKQTIPKSDSVIKNISQQYFLFQEFFSEFINHNLEIACQKDSYQDKYLVINNLFYISRDKSVKFRYTQDYSKTQNGLNFSGYNYYLDSNDPIEDSFYSILPQDLKQINVFGDNFLKNNSKLEEPIKMYFIEHFNLLYNAFNIELKKLYSFLNALNDIFHVLNSSDLFLNDYIIADKKHSTNSIYDIINSHNEVFQITCDINIEKELEIMKKNQKTKKMENKNESFV